MKASIYFFTIVLFLPVINIQNAHAQKHRENIKIEASEAANYKGSNVTVCGIFAQQKSFSKGTYINIDGIFPRQKITFILCGNEINKFERRTKSLGNLIGKRLCATGKIKEYKNSYQININDEKMLSVMKSS